jgi:thioredoxin 2
MSESTAAAIEPIHVACPQCHGLARVPAGRLGGNPKCPRCKSLLLKGTPVTLDAASFTTHTSAGTLPVLVDFWAEWCGPCKMMAPVLDRFAELWATRLQVGKVDTEAQGELAAKFDIRSIPTLILIRGGRELARQSGAVDLGSLTRWVDSALNRS